MNADTTAPETVVALSKEPRQRLTATERSARMRRRIVNAASRIFSKMGYANATVADILKEAGGMSRRSFYEHFDSKEDALLAIVDEGAAIIADGLARMAEVDDPLARIDLGIETFVTWGAPEFTRIGYQVMAAGERVRKRRLEYGQQIADIFTENLWEAHRRGLIQRPPDPITVLAILDAVDGTVLRYHAEGRADRIHEAVPYLQALAHKAFC